MNIYKTIKRWKGKEYILAQSQANSRKCYVEQWDRKTNTKLDGVAEIDNKTDEIKYLAAVPEEVSQAIGGATQL